MIQSLKEAGEKVDTIDWGFGHVIAKTSLGKIYTWGWGLSGQLGHGISWSELSPRYLNLDKKNRKNKAVQIAAGYEHSVVLLENRDILWFGRNGTLIEPELKPVKLDLSVKLPEIFPPFDSNSVINKSIDFLVAKINWAWNKSISLTDIVIADVRNLEGVSSHVTSSTIKSLSQNWSSKDIEPPYVESIAKYFSVDTMRKQTIIKKSKPLLKTKIGAPSTKQSSPYGKSKRMY